MKKLLIFSLLLFVGCAVPARVAVRRQALGRCMLCLQSQVAVNAQNVVYCQYSALEWCDSHGSFCTMDDMCEATDIGVGAELHRR